MEILPATKGKGLLPWQRERDVRVASTISVIVTLRIKSGSMWLWFSKFCVSLNLKGYLEDYEETRGWDTKPQPAPDTQPAPSTKAALSDQGTRGKY